MHHWFLPTEQEAVLGSGTHPAGSGQSGRHESSSGFSGDAAWFIVVVGLAPAGTDISSMNKCELHRKVGFWFGLVVCVLVVVVVGRRLFLR